MMTNDVLTGGVILEQFDGNVGSTLIVFGKTTGTRYRSQCNPR